MKITVVSRQTVFTYRDTVVEKGVKGLLSRRWAGARKPAVRGALTQEFLEKLEEGKFRQARDAQSWIKKRTRKTLTESGGVRQLIRRLGREVEGSAQEPCEKGHQGCGGVSGDNERADRGGCWRRLGKDGEDLGSG